MGGGAAGAVPLADHDFALWEKRVDALMILCSAKGHFTVDGLRRVLEDMPPSSFEELSYYERWIASISQNLVEAGVLTTFEIGERMSAIQERGLTYGDASDG
ncbi:MAG: nitrile hydratase subunit beta [Yoonia sp.]|nr:nitrile hydratase subunit beta [Yoonia sp.]